MGCCGSKEPAADEHLTTSTAGTGGGGSGAKKTGFSNRPSAAVGDQSIAPNRRIQFGVVFPEEVSAAPTHMFFDKQKPGTKLLEAATAQAGLKMDKGKLVGSPERLNIFTLEGDVLRLDLEIEAHLGSTLRNGDTIVLEKGNRMSEERLQFVRTIR